MKIVDKNDNGDIDYSGNHNSILPSLYLSPPLSLPPSHFYIKIEWIMATINKKNLLTK